MRRVAGFVRTDIWREGEYLDLWSVPHFLSGMAVALGVYFFHFGIEASFIIALLLLVAYEMWEAMVRIEETRMNRILDVVVGMVSFTPTFLFAPRFPQLHLVVAFTVIVIGNSVLSYFGWLASAKADILERKVRAEFQMQKAKIQRRRESVQRRIQLQRNRFKMMKCTWKYQRSFRPQDKKM